MCNFAEIPDILPGDHTIYKVVLKNPRLGTYLSLLAGTILEVGAVPHGERKHYVHATPKYLFSKHNVGRVSGFVELQVAKRGLAVWKHMMKGNLYDVIIVKVVIRNDVIEGSVGLVEIRTKAGREIVSIEELPEEG